MNKFKFFLYLFACTNIYCGRAYSFSTDWQTSLGGSSRIILEKPKADRPSVLKGAIEINLKAGWKTYWRNPGSNGLPPRLVLDKESAKKAKTQLFYPAPELIINSNNWINGYHNHLFLPFVIGSIDNGPLPESLTGSAQIGMCKDICIPVINNFKFTSSTLSDSKWQDRFLLISAFAALPKAPSNSFSITNAYIKDNRLFMSLKHLTNKNPPQIFLDSDNLTLDKPQLLNHDKIYSIFGATILNKSLVKNPIIHYTAINGNEAVAGEITL
ncbi:protein-disulfide reductase DsbD domain-containing protein [Bartonella sp. TP]|uniref:protein-disulfide reductase DsbD domain-containing protein n=1 Tax=Bartonella sp. TP TaxID=3057550 RepID=UPI0025B14675|nr:protein-disulfide reductase DsbD domain-containing protein [Bartonella sp. TP]MDN5249556.1 protein-disulfide reductase DsbD family protein [Alphaproteobacteria bacterium]WJW80187.1 protein-disulfide reductase DsbD family protein [Bartonella sp. TP]